MGRYRRKRSRLKAVLVPVLVALVALDTALLLILPRLRAGAAELEVGPAPSAPEAVQSGTETSGGSPSYQILSLTREDLGQGELILVSNQHPYAFSAGVEEQLTSVVEAKSPVYGVNNTQMRLLPVTIQHLNTLLEDYAATTPHDKVVAISGYRTYEYQQGLFERSAQRNGLEHATRFVAQAGGSEHHTGYAVDLGTRPEIT